MSARFHYFSHLENLARGELVLTNPFLAAREALLLCRYALHRQSAEVLAPDPEFTGLARWHRLLPLERTAAEALPCAPLFCLEELPATGCEARYLLRPEARWPYWIASAPLAESRTPHALALSPDGVASCLRGALGETELTLWLPAGQTASGDQPLRGSFSQAWRDARASLHDAADLGPWGNPYRLEAWKAVGLELALRHDAAIPTLLVHDPCGELLAGLTLAAEHLAAFRADPPYRLIAIQRRPFHQLAQLFEGATPDWEALASADNRATLPLAVAAGRYLREGLTHLRGTVVALEAEVDEAALFETALARLMRAHFIDDEDVVYQLTASY